MSGIQSKITRHAKKQENTIHNKEKNQSTETDPEMTKMIELVNMDIKTLAISVFYMIKKLKGILNLLNIGMEDIKD